MKNLAEVALGFVCGMAILICVANTLWQFSWIALTTAGKAIGPWHRGIADPRFPAVASGSGGGEPAHRAYWSRQMWRDAGAAAQAGLLALWYRLKNDWLVGTVRRLFLGRRPGNQVEPSRFNRTLRRILAPGTAVGAVLGALLATAITGLTLAVFAVLLGVVCLLAVVGVLVLRATERGWAVMRGIRMKCPYPGCYRPIRLAVHVCPGCQATHRTLRPGRYGALWHVCVCGQRLAAVRLVGRGRLLTRCPHCDESLPEAVGTTPVVHVPLVGGTSSGKTMLMAAIVEGLHSWSRRSGLTVEYASPADRREAGALNQQLKQTGWAHATTGGQPRAFLLRIGYGRRYLRRQRVLYLYDPMGESLREAAVVREQHYLAHADGVVLVVDVLAEPEVRRALSEADARRAGGARPAAQGPSETYERLAGELAALTGRRRRLAVAAVVTKRDVLDQLGSLPVPGVRIADWLTAIGLGRLVRGLGHDFAAVRYWAVSAHAATGAGALESEQRRAAEPVLWLLARSGLRTGALAADAPPGTVPRPRGQGVRERSAR